MTKRINFRLFILVVAGMVIISTQLAAQRSEVNIIYPPLTSREGKGMNIPIPPDEHPRLFLMKKDIPDLRRKTENPFLQATWNRLVEDAGNPTDGTLIRDGAKPNLDMKIIRAIEAKAFFYVFSNDLESGKRAVEALFNFNNTLIIDYNKNDNCRDIGRVILTNAIVYDWCYDLIPELQKRSLIERMEKLGTEMEIEWPKLIQGSIVGHGVEAQLARDMLACGIAVYDEKPEIYNLVAGRIIAEFVPARKFFYSASYHHQGSSYGHYRFIWDMYITLIFDRMGYPDILGKDQATVPYWWIYTRRPDGQLLRDGDDFCEIYNDFGKYWEVQGNAYVGSYFHDPVLMDEAIRHYDRGYQGMFDFLLLDPFTPEKDKTSLSLSRYFKEPLGAMVARTGWGEEITSNTVIAEMKIGVYNYANHQHLDAGSFQIYYKGPLTVESGVYQGTSGSYGSEHFLSYYQRTIAHNSMLILDPDEIFLWWSTEVINDGGQQYPNNGREPVNLEMFLSNDYKTGEVLAHDFGPDMLKPDYTYLKGELAEAYSDKVKSFKRSFVFLNMDNPEVPAALIVFDRVNSSDKDFKKYWLLHCVEEPEITENITTIRRTGKGYNGQLVNTTLLPVSDNLTIHKIGGKDNEYSVFGKNYPSHIRRDKNSFDGVAWRIEVSPRNASTADNFLNVLQVMDYDGGTKRPLPTRILETDDLCGAKIGNRMVFFSKNGSLIDQPFQINITSDEARMVLITDISQGTWKIVCSENSISSTYTVIDDKNLIYFEAKKGKYTLTKG
ncbi:heparin/heparin-sulfate lyase HepB [Bacteroidota bacterium]